MTCELIPIELSDEQKGHICGILSVGCDWQTAVNFVGCSLADIRAALAQDPQFAASVFRAEAGAELSHMRTIQQAAKEPKNWRASVWWLERHSPERFGPRGAGVVTARHLKAYIAILADVMRDQLRDPEHQQQFVARLKLLADSVDRMLRDAQSSENGPIGIADPQSPDIADSRDVWSRDSDNFNGETSM